MRATKKATNSSSSAGSEFEVVTEISCDEFRRPKSVKLSSEPGDAPGEIAAALRHSGVAHIQADKAN